MGHGMEGLQDQCAIVTNGVCLGGVSNADIDGNNALQIKVIGVVISTFETLPTGVKRA
jgi:hypothetical protein